MHDKGRYYSLRNSPQPTFFAGRQRRGGGAFRRPNSDKYLLVGITLLMAEDAASLLNLDVRHPANFVEVAYLKKYSA